MLKLNRIYEIIFKKEKIYPQKTTDDYQLQTNYWRHRKKSQIKNIEGELLFSSKIDATF